MTRDVARSSLDYLRAVGVTTIPFTLLLRTQTSLASKGLMFKLRFRRTIRVSNQSVIELTDRECPLTCASRPVTAFFSAVWRIASDLNTAHLLPVGTTETSPGPSNLFHQPVRRPPYKAVLLWVAELPNNFMMRSFRARGSPRTFWTGAAVDES